MSVMDVFVDVMKADEAAGCAFIDAVVYDYLTDYAKIVEKDITGLYSLVNLDRIQVAKRQLGRSYVEMIVGGQYPSDEIQKAAEYLAGLEQYVVSVQMVSKDFEWFNMNGTQRQVDVERDAKGQFARKISSTSRTDLKGIDKPADSKQVAPSVRNSLKTDASILTDDKKSSERERLERVQSQHEQTIRVAGEFKDALRGVDPNKVDVTMMIATDNGDIVSRTARLSDFGNETVPVKVAANETVFAMSVAPAAGAGEDVRNKVGTYNLLGARGGAALASMSTVDPARLKELQSNLQMGSNPDQSKLTRFFGQLQSGGNVLSQVTGQDKLGQTAAFIGSVGPQAEQVLGPYAQRAAYRYRGTETTPDEQLVGQFKQIDQMERAGITPTQADTPVEGFDIAARKKGLSGDALAMQVRGDVASAELARTLPRDPMVARLSELSGQILPSQGVLINAQGKIVSQSVGFTDDHYLPFDLKNLGSLRGGQYARTRMSGGLTGEDIYAAVTMGARNVQVISPSGVFTLEMAPDFRGARGNSDKARGMCDRYLKILDAVANSGEYLVDVSPQEKSRIRAGIRDAGLKGDDALAAYSERVDRARQDASRITNEDEAAASAKVLAEMGYTAEKPPRGVAARAYEENLEDEIQRVASTKANKLRLNGEGYAVALQTLQQQFPYFIRRVGVRDLNTFVNEGGPSLRGEMPKGRTFTEDRGYTKPGALRAQGIKAGFYDRGTPQLQNKPRTGQASAPKEEAPETPKPAAEGAAAPTDTKDVPPAAPVALNSRMEKKRAQLHETVMAQQTQLKNELAAINVNDEATEGLSFDEAAQASPVNFAGWLMSQNLKTMNEIFSDRGKALLAARALGDPKAVQGAFKQAINTTNGNEKDWIEAENEIAGHKGAAAMQWVSDTAADVADGLILAGGPFVSGSDPFHGAKATDLPVPQAYPGIDRIQTGAQVLDAYKQEPKPIADMARELVTSDDGTQYRSLVEMNNQVVERVKALKAVADAKRAMDPDTTNDNVFDVVNQKAMMTAFEYGSLTQDDYGMVNLPKDADIPGLIRNFPAEEEAAALQRAWSLAMTTRLVNAFDAGEAVPKGDDRIVKAANPVRVEVLSKSHPLSKAVARRAAQGLPFVPHRTGRVLTGQGFRLR